MKKKKRKKRQRKKKKGKRKDEGEKEKGAKPPHTVHNTCAASLFGCWSTVNHKIAPGITLFSSPWNKRQVAWTESRETDGLARAAHKSAGQ